MPLCLRRRVLAPLVAAACAIALLPAHGQEAGAGCDASAITRTAGSDRVLTAVALSRHWVTDAEHAVLARADAFPDALAAAALAARLSAPVLLTPPDALPMDVADELVRLGVETVWVAGGEAAVSDDVIRQVRRLPGFPQVDRISGPDRYATAAALAIAAGASDTVALATGSAFPDAVSAGGLAGAQPRVPTLLTLPDRLPDVTRKALRDLGSRTVLIVGGERAVARSVEDDLRRDGYAVHRIAGRDRYETGVAVAREVLNRRTTASGVLLATGRDFPDALAVSAAGPGRGAVALLVAPDRVPGAVEAFLDQERDALGCRHGVAGGTAAVSEATVDAAASQLRAARLSDPALPEPQRVLAAGDIARCGLPGAEHTAQLIDALPGIVLALGDLAYDSGTAEEFRDCYDPTWGRHRARTRPAPGNHEHRTPGAAGYFDYWGAVAGEPGRGWYGADVGAHWRILALNSNCGEVGGCHRGSPQERWLREELEAAIGRNVLAFWHHPRWASGRYGDDPRTEAFVEVLHEAGATLLLAGHEHHYERMSPVDPDGTPNADGGVRQFIVGTGGAQLRPFLGPPGPITEVRDASTHGILELMLRPAGYEWRFVPVTRDGFIDAGRGWAQPRR